MVLRKLLVFAILCGTVLMATSAQAGLTGFYYNLSDTHPDMERWITGLDQGYVESALTGATPTLSAYGATRVLQWDWWDSQYFVGSRVDSDADLQSNFASSFFPAITNTGLSGDPFDFAVRWTGKFYVANDQTYTYSMGSDDDSWLFIDKSLTLDLGGVHGMSFDNYNVFLTKGYHDIDIYFAERHTSQSGFQLNFFSDLEPSTVPEPATLILFGFGLLTAGFFLRKR
jgi:fibro-slime domain-containing protein